MIAEGTPETIARSPGSATGEYLARVLRGEPLVPLSDVTFADELGRGAAAPTNGSRAAGPSSRPTKRAAAAAARAG